MQKSEGKPKHTQLQNWKINKPTRENNSKGHNSPSTEMKHVVVVSPAEFLAVQAYLPSSSGYTSRI